MSTEIAQAVLPGFAGTTTAVTGGASGIGRATSLMAARSGARVIAGDMNDDYLAEVEQLAKAEGLDLLPVKLDVTDPASVAAFIDIANSQEQRLHGVVASAGIAPDSLVLDMSLELWSTVIAVNLTGFFLTAQLAGKVLVENGTGGSIVGIGSAMGNTGAVSLGHYSATKGGMLGLMRTMAKEWGKYDIRVNCCSPGGGISTPLFWSRSTPEQVEKRVAGLPIPRLGEPDDMANCIGFLLSDLSPWITGQNLHVNGGSLMY